MKIEDRLIRKRFWFNEEEFEIRETRKEYSKEKLYLHNITKDNFVCSLYSTKTSFKERIFIYNDINIEKGKKYHYILIYDMKKDSFQVEFSHTEEISEDLKSIIQNKRNKREQYKRRMEEIHEVYN